eukprot:Pompholyxophrys_punicea_v1_NODE_25_length_5265_cov_107.938388.p4 type:complete len:228 gc:universal NODE_25_length_5265_cov_107.938388:2649-1966(-)
MSTSTNAASDLHGHFHHHPRHWTWPRILALPPKDRNMRSWPIVYRFRRLPFLGYENVGIPIISFATVRSIVIRYRSDRGMSTRSRGSRNSSISPKTSVPQDVVIDCVRFRDPKPQPNRLRHERNETIPCKQRHDYPVKRMRSQYGRNVSPYRYMDDAMLTKPISSSFLVLSPSFLSSTTTMTYTYVPPILSQLGRYVHRHDEQLTLLREQPKRPTHSLPKRRHIDRI